MLLFRYVKLEYVPAHSVEETAKLLQAPEHEFVEGLTYNETSTVVIYGNFVNQLSPEYEVG
jgi:hypothetical protein